MYSKLGNGTAWLLTFVIFTFFSARELQATSLNNDSTAETGMNVSLTATPANCVALHQGRKCFAQVSLIWKTPQFGHYCVYQKSTNQVLQCWKNSNGNQLSFEFQSSEKIEYTLVEFNQKEVLAKSEINVSWVHKSSPRKRRWRLF